MPSLVPIERSEMTPEMWDKIRNYIVKQREKRKQGLIIVYINM